MMSSTTLLDSLGWKLKLGGEEMRKMKTLNSVKKQGQVVKSGLNGGNKKKSDGGSKKDDGDGNNGKVSSLTNGNRKMEDEDSEKTDVANGKKNVGVDVSMLAKLRGKVVRGRGDLRKTDSIGNNNKGSKVTVEPKKATKKNRVWDDSASKPQEKLDFTDENGGKDDVVVGSADQGESVMDKK